MSLSVAIVVFNEEDNLPRSLEAIKAIADEIIAVDSHSTDKTREIAASFGAKVYEEDWKGHIAQKNSALDKCSQDWILAIDADEVVSPKLALAIKNVVENGDCDGYEINRQSVYLGRTLRFMWQPDRKLRLVRRSANPRWGGYDPHDKLFIKGKTGRLEGVLTHYSYKDLADHWRRLIAYAQTGAISYNQNGKKFSFFKLFANPILGVLKSYLLRGGFLDGLQGFFAAVSKGVYIFLKYAFLWEIERQKSKNLS
ncbi:MAG: glycosyltransferase family 2 protein [Helicobacteraceae bacterium]|jgi:glycosyltransferase involved in cell wall biosynthesis|nr:glycosyltransferase family 2 protein [Helicobacteraceae bacterium]